MATQSSWRAGPGPAAAAAPSNGTAGASAPKNARWGPGMHRHTGPTASSPAAVANQQPVAVMPQQQQEQQQSHASSLSNGASINTSAHQAPNAASSASVSGQTKQGSPESVQRDRMTFLLIGLVGNTVVATIKGGVKYIGILSSTSTGSPDGRASNGTSYGADAKAISSPGIGIVLSCAQQMLDGDKLGPIKRTLLIRHDELEGFVAQNVGLDVPVSMSRGNQAGFRTDTEISKTAIDPFGEGRTLQKWSDESMDDSLESSMAGLDLDGKKSNQGGAWDQFATNEAKFGIKSNYEETLYTTKLDRSGNDFKERERKADQLAREIMGGATNNIHIAEERNLVAPGAASGPTEEDRYGAVVRNEGAYIPPAARRAAAAAGAGAGTSTGEPVKANGSAPPLDASPASASLESAKASPAAPSMSSAAKPTPPAIVTTSPSATPSALTRDESKPHSAMQPQLSSQEGHLGDFQKFLSQERERLGRKKAAFAKDYELADLKKWGDKFQLSSPVPDDIAQIRGAAQSKIVPTGARPSDASLQKSASAASKESQGQLAPPGTGTGGSASARASPAREASTLAAPSEQRSASETKPAIAKMMIPKIPPFNPDRARARQAELLASSQLNKQDAAPPGVSKDAPQGAASSGKTTFKLSAKATSFNPNASSFTPGAAPKSTATQTSGGPSTTSTQVLTTAAATPSTASKPAVPVNPFFANRVIKKSAMPLHVRDDFNPFKTDKVLDAYTIGAKWGFTGKPYRQLFHSIPPEEGSAAAPGAQGKAVPSSSGTNTNIVPGSMPAQQGVSLAMTSPRMPQPSPQSVHAHVQHQHTQVHQPPQHMTPRTSQGSMPPGAAGTASLGQPFYVPYPGYRYTGGHQPMQQVAAYGMPPQMMGQVPFSPPMGHPGPSGMYSPQMSAVIAGGPMPNMMAAGAPMRGNNNQSGSSMHQKGPPPMYYPGQPVQGLPYGVPFAPHANPSPIVRPQHTQQHPHPAQQQLQQHMPGVPGPGSGIQHVASPNLASGPLSPSQAHIVGPPSGQPLPAAPPQQQNTSAASSSLASTPVLTPTGGNSAAPARGSSPAPGHGGAA